MRGQHSRSEVEERSLQRIVVPEPETIPRLLRGAPQRRPLIHTLERTSKVSVVEKGVTEEASISRPVHYQYRTIFNQWVEEESMTDSKLLEGDVTDKSLVHFFDNCDLSGQGPSTGTELLSALRLYRPEIGHWG